jgi:hypothetical protein
MKKFTCFLIAAFCTVYANSQTVIDMQLPAQPADSLQVIALFDESLPTDIPVVLSIIGFDIHGGWGDNVFTWYKDNQVIGTGSTVVFTPVKGSNYAFSVKDKKNCSVLHSLNLSTVNKVKANQNFTQSIHISPNPAKDFINIEFRSFHPVEMYLKIFDMNGKLWINRILNDSEKLPVSVPDGTYLIVIGNGDYYSLNKILIKN